jgi:hypothetical protein
VRACIGVAILLSLTAAACATVAPNGPFSLSVATGLQPSRSADDAVRISRAYLDAQTPEAEGPHISPRITAVWAVRANDARALDGCIPSGGGNQIVWVTKGQGDYLNLRDYPWSHSTGLTNNVCELPGTEGTLVVDDATGVILGVYPESPGYPHPSP